MNRWLWLPAVLAVPLLLFVRPEKSWLLALVPLTLLLQARGGVDGCQSGRRELLPLTALNPALLLLAVMLLAGLWVTPDLSFSLSKIAGLLLGFLLFFTIMWYTPTRKAWLVTLSSFIAVGVGVALLGLLGTQWFKFKLTVLNDLTGRLPVLVKGLPGADSGIHPNILAGALLWVLPAIVFTALALVRYPDWFLLTSIARRKRWLVSTLALGIAAFFVSVVLILAQSRSAYLAVGLTSICLILALLPRRTRWLALALGLFGLAAGIGWANQYGWQRLLAGPMNTLPVGEGVLSTVTFAQRLEIWSRAQWAIRDVPLTGLGMDVFRVAMPLLYPLLSYDPAAPVAHAHNELLQAALDLGLPGLVAFLAINLGRVRHAGSPAAGRGGGVAAGARAG